MRAQTLMSDLTLMSAHVASGCTNQKINLRVWLKIPDAEAATVKNTLVRRLGFGKSWKMSRRSGSSA